METVKSSDLDAAHSRLEKLLERFDVAIQHISEKMQEIEILEADKIRLENEVEALRSDGVKLGKRVTKVESDFAALEKVADDVSSRLDTTINRLKTVIEG